MGYNIDNDKIMNELQYFQNGKTNILQRNLQENDK